MGSDCEECVLVVRKAGSSARRWVYTPDAVWSTEPEGVARMARSLFVQIVRIIRNLKMPREDNIEAEGVVIESLRNASFKVKLANGHIVACTISCKIRVHHIRILEGDKVKVEISPYDINKGRITYRMK